MNILESLIINNMFVCPIHSKFIYIYIGLITKTKARLKEVLTQPLWIMNPHACNCSVLVTMFLRIDTIYMYSVLVILNLEIYLKFRLFVFALPNALALFKVRLCITLAPKNDQFSRKAEALFLKDRPFCLLG